MKVKTITTILKKIGSFFSGIVNRLFVIPMSKFVLWVNTKFEKPSKRIENWLSRSNTLLFISLLMAIAVFIIIDQKILTYSESSAEVLPNIPVKLLYDEDNYVVEGAPSSVDITLIGNKVDLYTAKQSPTSEVTMNLWGLKPGTHKVDIKYNQAAGSVKSSVNPSVATVVVYEKVLESKTLTVDLLNQDLMDERYIIDQVEALTDNVTIKGASYKVAKVATVKALVDVNTLPKFELGKPVTVSSSLKAYDESGNVVDVEISPAKTDVQILISSPSKEVPLQVIPHGNVIYNMGISNIAINSNQNTTVTIYGPESVLAGIEYIPVNINVEGLSESTEFKVALEKPVGVKTMSVNNVTVNVTLNDDITNVDIEDVVITFINRPSNYGVTPKDIDTVTVKLKGVSDVVKTITASDVRAYVDLQGLGTGEHDLPIVVEGNDPRVEYLSSVLKVSVRIYERPS